MTTSMYFQYALHEMMGGTYCFTQIQQFSSIRYSAVTHYHLQGNTNEIREWITWKIAEDCLSASVE